MILGWISARNWKCVSDVHVLLLAERPVFCEDSSSCQISTVKVKHCGFNYVEMMPDTFPQCPPPPSGALLLSVYFNYRDESVTALLVTDLLHNGLHQQMNSQGFPSSSCVQVQQQPFTAPTPPAAQDGTVDRSVPCKSATRGPVSHAWGRVCVPKVREFKMTMMIINKYYLWWCCKYEWAKISRIRRCQGAAMAQTHTGSCPAAGGPRATSWLLPFTTLEQYFVTQIWYYGNYFALNFISVSLKEQRCV